MNLRLYNTLSKRVEPFEPLHPGRAGVYACGPTIYDFAHIGNFRSFIVYDLVHRVLVWSGLEVRFVMNLTDVDDKTIRGAQAAGEDLSSFTAPFAEAVLADASRQFSFPPAPACLFGVSQGGAIALQTAARSPAKWKAVASVATFASLDRPVLRAAENLLPEPLRFCSPLAAFSVGCGTRLRAGFWPADIRPVDAAGKLNQPVFIGHGDRDESIGIDQARDIFAAIPGGRKKFRVVAGADHNHVLSKGSHALYADLCQFFLAAVGQTGVPFERAE